MKRLFIHDDDVLLSRRFSRLHLSVLDLISDDLGQTLEKSTVLAINGLDSNSRTPLYWAVRRADAQSSKQLLQFGADPNVGTSAIAWTCSNAFATPECLHSLLKAGADPNGLDLDCHTALHACGSFGKGEDFISPLIRAGAQVDAVYKGEIVRYHGMTALGFASLNAHPQSIKVLLKYGSTVDWKDDCGRSPLHLAVTRCCDETAKVALPDALSVLLQGGSDPEVRDARGFNPANVAMSTQDIESLATLMDFGSNIVYPPDLGPSSNGYCMLAWPFEKNWDIVSTFLLRHRDVNILDRHPRTKQSVLHLLAKYGNRRLLVVFEETINSSQLDTQAIDIFDRTPLDYFNARDEKSKAVTETFTGLLCRIQAAQRDGLRLREGSAQIDITYNVREDATILENSINIALETETHQIVGNKPTTDERAGSKETFAGSTWEDDPKDPLSTLGELRYEDQDSEQALTILAWQTRNRNRQAKRKDRDNDSGYASIKSNSDTEDEEDAFVPANPHNVPGMPNKDLKRDLTRSASSVHKPLLPSHGCHLSDQRCGMIGLGLLFLTVLVVDVIRILPPFLIPKGLEPPYFQAVEIFLNATLGVLRKGQSGTVHPDISFLFTGFALVLSIPVCSAFSGSASLKGFCVRVFRPCVPRNHQRITWVCVSIQCLRQLIVN